MLDAKKIKSIVLDQGADLCGIAPAQRFARAPEGFRPTDIYEKCRSIIVFANALPIQSLFSSNCIPYTFANRMITEKVDRLTFDLCLHFQKSGIHCVPIPSDDPYEYWIETESYGRAILSLRHAGYLAGLGVLGKNTLLINEHFGNMIQLGAVLTDLELEGDPIATYESCAPDCHICLESCPAQALDGQSVAQKLCRPLSTYKTAKGYILKKCNACRKACPNYAGITKKESSIC
jgi:epoxyqueuosine reductase QueG